MQMRTYAVALIAAAMALFAATIGLNVIVDPEGVLGTGLLGASPNVNDRYTRMRAYQAAPESYNGLLFGSSRSVPIEPEVLSARMGGARFAHFGVLGGQITDHLAVLEYVVRSKAAKGETLRSVFLLLDTDLFGERPIGNSSIQTLWPPALTGESPWRFTWRYLTAIQPAGWRSQIRRALLPAALRAVSAATGAAGAWAADSTSAGTAKNQNVIHESNAARSDLPRQLTLLARFVAICLAHDIDLAVALSPLHHHNATQYDPADLIEVADKIAAIVPVWDFGAPEWLTARDDLWFDGSHFKPSVFNMMLDRMFGGRGSAAPPDFGVLRSAR